MAYQLSARFSGIDQEKLLRLKFLRMGKKWHRRMVASKEHHLWATVWRMKNKIVSLDDRVSYMQTSWKPIPRQLGWFRRLAWRVVFGEAYDEEKI